MKNIFTILCSIIVQIGLVKAQVQKKMILEHFTNTKCSICASRNPGLNTNLNANPQVQRISIHPSSPYSTCFLSQQNTADNDARTNYYNIYGATPRLIINGTLIASAQNYADAAMFTPFISQSDFTIAIQQFAVGVDSIRSEISIKRIATGALNGTASLFAGLVEDTVFGNGGNGENLHFNVLRRALFTPQGQQVNLPVNVGDSIVFSKTENFNPIWNSSRMRTVAILQEEVSKQLIQSELSTTTQIGAPTALSELANRNGIKVFPNPANQFLEITTQKSSSFNYVLANQFDQTIMQNTVSNGERINVSGIAEGIYFLKLFDESCNKVFKVVINH